MEAAIPFLIDEINLQTKRVLDFQAFRNSPILSRFLEYIVEETIQERAQHIKEYNIALNVLNRLPDFNPNEDSIVRIHAGRLRRALNDYYLTQGIYDTIIIQIPKGCYMPQFIDGGTLKSNDNVVAPVSPEQQIKPIVAVFPFRTTTQSPDMTEFSFILREQFSAELSRFPEISVIGYYSTETMKKIKENIVEAGKSVHADYIITGNLQNSDQTIRIRVNMLTPAGEVLMTKSFEREILNPEIFEIPDEIIQSVKAEVEHHHSLICQEMAKAKHLLPIEPHT